MSFPLCKMEVGLCLHSQMTDVPIPIEIPSTIFLLFGAPLQVCHIGMAMLSEIWALLLFSPRAQSRQHQPVFLGKDEE